MEKDKKTFFTKQGLAKLKEEYKRLTSVARKRAAERIKRVREDGDLDENAEYVSALEEQGKVESRIKELEEILKDGTLIRKKAQAGVVCLGSTVVVEVEGEKDEFTIVGSVEADPTKGLISNESPVGQALLGAKVGDVVEVSSAIKTSYKIVEIR